MFLNNEQFLGSICGIDAGGAVSGCGNFSGSGFYNAVGRWSGFGLYSGRGYFEGSGKFWASGNHIDGNAPGFVPNAPWDQVGNGLPYLTYSGYGAVVGSDVEGYYPRPEGYFHGRNSFTVSGVITGNRVSTNTFTGNGVVTGSGYYFIIGEVQATGIIQGSGCITGFGRLRRTYPTPEAQQCYACHDRIMGSGEFAMSGLYSGLGIIKAYTQSGAILTGTGAYYNLSGNFSGYSDKAFWGFGNFTGDSMEYPDRAKSEGFYGIGYFSGTGTIRGELGWFSGSGYAKGDGFFAGLGTMSGLNHISYNIVSGSGCVNGYGEIWSFNPVTMKPTGILCRTVDPYEVRRRRGCGNFPPYLTDCNEVGDIGLDFEYGGNCAVAGVD